MQGSFLVWGDDDFCHQPVKITIKILVGEPMPGLHTTAIRNFIAEYPGIKDNHLTTLGIN